MACNFYRLLCLSSLVSPLRFERRNGSFRDCCLEPLDDGESKHDRSLRTVLGFKAGVEPYPAKRMAA